MCFTKAIIYVTYTKENELLKTKKYCFNYSYQTDMLL